MAEAELSTDQSAGSTSGLVSAIRLRLKGFETSRLLPIFFLALIFLLALFLRSYFAYDLSASNDWLMSGGSDSFYYKRLMDHAAVTGEHLHWDDMLNYPDGARNPRPPLYTFSVAVPAVLTNMLFPSTGDAVGFYLIMSTAFWGALTVIPAYFIAKEIFNRRTGYIAALYLAIIPSHVERSVATLADHDSFALFLIVLTIFFLMKALKTADNSKWVEKWSSPRSIFRGMGTMMGNNRRAIAYSLLAGTSFAAIAMAWVGYAYVEVILLAYFIVQLLINKFKGTDSTTQTMLFFIMFSFAFLITFPVYWQMDIIASRFDVPVYLFGAAIVVGFMFSSARDMPWIIVLPILAGIVIVAVLVTVIVYPPLGEAILTGQGYFSPSKLYTTIAEAKAPVFSQLAISFGIVTFYLSFVGLILMLSKVPKRVSGDYIIISVWLATAIFMATSAGRFMFNAAPAFAIASAWVTLLIIDKLEFKTIGKMFSGASGGYLRAIRKSVKVRHVIGALFILFMLLVPNIWFALDAGIPRETKTSIDADIYNSVPDFLKPSGFSDQGGWYLGAFGYSLPLPNYYFPSFWNWFSQQDAGVPENERPAYVSWWDYGFESIEAGGHPAVADNFQQGYQIGGNILLATSEAQAIGLMIARLAYYGISKLGLTETIAQDLSRYGASIDVVQDVASNPLSYKNTILQNPEKYGSATSDISTANIFWRFLGGYFADLGLENEVMLYKDVRDHTGHDIGYIGVDSRLLPKTATDTGVFYAPAKLTDRPIDDNGNPSDFYTIKAVDSSGTEYDLDDVSALRNVQIVDYKLVYHDEFFSTMVYRAFAGIPPVEAGETNDGLPSYSGSAKEMPAMPAWNMTHFIMVYRTAYYNPSANATAAWQAVSLDQAVEYQNMIDSGQIEGIVDGSMVNTYQAGVVLLRYYDGAVMSGTIRDTSGAPAPDVRLTVDDKYGIPHQTVLTGGDGAYSLILPPGADTITMSSGKIDTTTLKGENVIKQFEISVSDDAAQRLPVDSDNDGFMDWQVFHDDVVPSATLQIKFFWDVGGDGNFTADTDIKITDASYSAYNSVNGITYSGTASSDGESEMLISPGKYELNTTVFGITTAMEIQATATPGALLQRNIARQPTTISGTAMYTDGAPLEGVSVTIKADAPNLYLPNPSTVTDSNGEYSFEYLLPGQYSLTAQSESGALKAFSTIVLTTKAETQKTWDIVLRIGGTLDLAVKDPYGALYPYAIVRIVNCLDANESISVKTDINGFASVGLPEGSYSVISGTPSNSGYLVGGTAVEVKRFQHSSCTVSLTKGIWFSGKLKAFDFEGEVFYSEGMTIMLRSGPVVYQATTGKGGAYGLYVPPGDYELMYRSIGSLETMQVTIDRTKTIDLTIPRAITLSGIVWHDRNGDGVKQSNENVSLASVRVLLPNGVTIYNQTDVSGNYAIIVPANTEITVIADAVGYEISAPITVSTAGYNLARAIKLAIAPVSLSAQAVYGDLPLRDTTVQLINATHPYSFITDSNGMIAGSILPGIYNVVIEAPIGEGSITYYCSNRMMTVFVGSDVNGLVIPTERLLRVEGTITGIAPTSAVMIEFEGPSETIFQAYGDYTAYLAEGSYTIHAYDLQSKNYGALFTAEVGALSATLDIALVGCSEVIGHASIGSRTADVITLNITRISDGLSMVRDFAFSNGYDIVVPSDDYSLSFEVRTAENLGRSQRYLLMTNASVLSISSDTTFNPIMKYGLDNSTLRINVSNSAGTPLVENVVFAGMNELAYSHMYVSDSAGKVQSTIHPGIYAVYIADHARRLSFLSSIKIERDQPIALDIIMSPGYLLTVAGNAQNLTDIEYLALTATDVVTSARLTVSGVTGSNINYILLPAGQYSVALQSERIENGKYVQYDRQIEVTLASDTTLDITLVKKSSFSVDAVWTPATKAAVKPGESTTYYIQITNGGNSIDQFTLSGTHDDFTFAFSTNPVTVGFGSTGNQATVAVTITAKSTAKVVHSDINIGVKSNGDQSAQDTVKVDIDVLPVYSIDQTILSGGRVNRTTYYREFQVINSGNIADNYTLALMNAGELKTNGWNVTVDKASTGSISPGTTATVNVTFTANRKVPNSNISVAIYVDSNSSSESMLVIMPPELPELFFDQTNKGIVSDDLYSYDIFAQRDTENLILLAVFLALIASIFMARKLKFGRFMR